MIDLTTLKSLDENRAAVKDACFEVGWHLLSPHNWTYINIFTGKRSEVTLESLIKAVEAKKVAANPMPTTTLSTRAKKKK
jgi:hypothetical protein